MNEMSVDEIKMLKRKFGISNARLSDESGVPLGTVNKVLSGATACPRNETLAALSAPLRKREEESRSFHAAAAAARPADSLLREEAATYGIPENKAPGFYTIEDYLALPGEHRVELIDGYFYDLAAPSTIHQRIALLFAYTLTAFVKATDGSCLPMISPVDVQPDPADLKTILQPDVLLLCDPSKLHKEGIIGAPDFILEIISPSTSARDYYKKASKYQESGVREYWIIDPILSRLTVYYFETGEPVRICPLEGSLGIGILEGKCEIDLEEIGSLCNHE